MTEGKIKSQIRLKLEKAFNPHFLELHDDSHHHAGHAGNPNGNGETHIGIVIVSNAFSGKNRVERSRMVHEIIRDEIAAIHAISTLRTLTPEEY